MDRREFICGLLGGTAVVAPAIEIKKTVTINFGGSAVEVGPRMLRPGKVTRVYCDVAAIQDRNVLLTASNYAGPPVWGAAPWKTA